MKAVITALAIALAALTGCSAAEDAAGKAAEKAGEKIAEKAGDVSGLDIDTEKGSISLTDKDGKEFTIGGTELPENWPTDLLAIPEDARIITTTVAGEDGLITYSTNQPAAEVLAGDAKALADAGFSEAMTSSAGQAQIRGYQRESGGSVNITVSGEGETTTVSVTYAGLG